MGLDFVDALLEDTYAVKPVFCNKKMGRPNRVQPIFRRIPSFWHKSHCAETQVRFENNGGDGSSVTGQVVEHWRIDIGGTTWRPYI